MTEPFLSEIRMMSFQFAPKSWAHCNGQLMPINQNQALFSLIGTQFGGDGQTNFALPDFRGRVPIHQGNGHTVGEPGGEQTHTLTIPELPSHAHELEASSAGADSHTPDSSSAPGSGVALYGPFQSPTPLESSAIGESGGGQPHQNMQPFLTLNFCIAMQGLFPSPN